jgi:hypothetical protein
LSYYQSLLSVAVVHGYNLNGVCAGLRFCPSEKTLSLIDKAGLVFKETIDGFCIVYDNSRLDALKLWAKDPLSFDFKVYSSNPDFKDFSEPFGPDSDGIFCFDNRATVKPGELTLAAPRFVSFATLKKSEWREYRQAKLVELEKRGELGDAEAGEYAEIEREIKKLKGEDQFYRELNRILSPQDYLVAPEFIVRIHADNEKESLLQQWLAPEPTRYTIRIDSRQRYWKYYLLGKIVNPKNSNEGFYIEDADHQVEFETIGEETLFNQRLAYTFRSKQKIPLNERYSFQFQLMQKAQGADTVIIPRLPYASVGQLGKEENTNQKTFVSEIYINS